MLEEEIREDNISLREKIIKFLKLDIFFSGIQLQFNNNRKEIQNLKDQISLQKDQIDYLKSQITDIQKLIKDASLVGVDIHRQSNSWGIVCLAGENTSFIKFFEISKNHTRNEVENIIRHIQPNKNNLCVDDIIYGSFLY